MEVIILAGGLGTRLRSMISNIPKCMAPVAGQPFISYLFSYLKKQQGITRVVLSVGYLHEAIISWNNSQKNLPFDVEFSIEEEPLGTGGAIKEALKKTNGSDIFILNGDTFFDVPLFDFLKSHKESSAVLSIALKPMKQFERYGNVIMNDNSIIADFQEKQYCEKGLINGGIYLLRKNCELMDGLPEKFSFETDVLQKKVTNKIIHGFVYDQYFIDIGIPDDYQKANTEFSFFFK